MIREAFRTRADAHRPSGGYDGFLHYRELAKVCPEFPFDPQQEIKDRFAPSRPRWAREIFTWATRRFSGS